MKKLLLLSLLLTACSPKLTPVIVPAPSHDTLIAHNHTLDSVRITTDTRYRFGSEITYPSDDRVGPPKNASKKLFFGESEGPGRLLIEQSGISRCDPRAAREGEGRRGTAIERPIMATERPCRVDTLVTTQVVEHYRIQHDTIRTSHRDTIPIIRTQEVVREVPKPVPRYIRYPAYAMHALIAALIVLIILKVAL